MEAAMTSTTMFARYAQRSLLEMGAGRGLLKNDFSRTMRRPELFETPTLLPTLLTVAAVEP